MTNLITPHTINFGNEKAGSEWMVINDAVMGGRTTANKSFTDSSLVLKGKLSLENNGGFSSMRANNSEDLSQYKTINITYKSDYDFDFRLELYRDYWMPNYKVALPKTQQQWVTKAYQLSEFSESIMGKNGKAKLTNLQLQSVIRIGFITAEKRPENFDLEVKQIQFQ
jgi:NADH dehydrogenase [ubiquinone] 1 alpha subcomplex assembly factor 1